MINAPCVPTAALHPQPHTSAAQGETLQHSSSLILSFYPAFLFLFLLMDIVSIFFSAHHLWTSCDARTGAAVAAAAAGDGGEAVTFKLWLSNPSLSDALGTRKQTRERGGKGGEKDQIYLIRKDRVDVRLRQILFP